MDDRSKNAVRIKLIEKFKKKPLDLIRILEMLHKEEKTFERETLSPPPMWSALYSKIYSRKGKFKKYAKAIVRDSMTDRSNPEMLHIIHRTKDEVSTAQCAKAKSANDALVRVGDMRLCHNGLRNSSGLARAWGLMPTKYKGRILIALNSLPPLAIVEAGVQRLLRVGLSAVHLTWSCWYYMRRWFKEEISGKKCAKKCIDACGSIAAGVGGGVVGSTVGTMVLPGVGTFVGGVIFAAGFEAFVKALLNRITRFLFGLPKNEAEERAYAFLGVHSSAKNSEINSKFRRKCLEYHPDKGGDVVKFHELQYCMSIIKMARGE